VLRVHMKGSVIPQHLLPKSRRNPPKASAMGAGISAMGPSPEALSALAFVEYDRDQCGRLTLDQCVQAAKNHFASTDTRPPEGWIWATVARHDVDGDGELDEHDLANAIEDLRRC